MRWLASLLLSTTAALRSQQCSTQRLTPVRGVFDALTGSGETFSDAQTLPGRWRLSFALPALDRRATVIAEFADEIGFEPPQGSLRLVGEDGAASDAGTWQLSEDPDDKRDGLWVWGLFEEPLYPFLLVALDSEAIGLPAGGRLALRLGHKSRPNEGEQLLSSGSVAARRKENYSADLFGLSSAALDEDTNIGTVSIQPVLR
jgi:hypothetical protein